MRKPWKGRNDCPRVGNDDNASGADEMQNESIQSTSPMVGYQAFDC